MIVRMWVWWVAQLTWFFSLVVPSGLGQKFSGVKVLDFIYTGYIHPTLLIPAFE